jgi:hypothetical protein
VIQVRISANQFCPTAQYRRVLGEEWPAILGGDATCQDRAVRVEAIRNVRRREVRQLLRAVLSASLRYPKSRVEGPVLYPRTLGSWA